MSNLKVTSLILGPLQTNCYFITDNNTRETAVVDPAANPARIIETITAHAFGLKYVVLTHGHFDHIGGVKGLLETFKCDLWIHEKDSEMLVDPELNFSAFFGDPIVCHESFQTMCDGTSLTLGLEKLTVLETPGHSPGSVSLAGDGFCVVGDTLFQSSIGRTDFPGSSHKMLIQTVKEKLFALSDDTAIFPGHGPDTSIGIEKRENPFFHGPDPYL